MLVDIEAEPGEEGRKVSQFEFGFQVIYFLFCVGIELGGIEASDRVCGEVTEGAVGPVDILEDTGGIIGDG